MSILQMAALGNTRAICLSNASDIPLDNQSQLSYIVVMMSSKVDIGVPDAAPHSLTTRASKRISYLTSRQQNNTIADSCRAAGVAYSTGMRWEKERRAGTFAGQTPIDLAARLTKDQALSILADRIRDGEQPTNVIAQAVSVAAKLEGWEAPTRIQSEIRIIPASVVSWIDTVALPDDPQPAHMLPDATVRALPAEAGTPPNAAESGAVGCPTNFSIKSEEK